MEPVASSALAFKEMPIYQVVPAPDTLASVDARLLDLFFKQRDILLRIMDALDGRSLARWFLVCKQTNTLTRDWLQFRQPWAWQKVCHYKKDTQDALTWYLKKSELRELQDVRAVELDVAKGEENLIEVMRHFPGCENVRLRNSTDAVVCAILKLCPELRRIDVGSPFNVKPVYALSRVTGVMQCRALPVRCVSPTPGDAALHAVASDCPLVTQLDFAGCREITDEGVQAVARVCFHLEQMNLSCCEKITDASVTALATSCTKLREMSLFGCTRIGGASVMALADFCTSLEALNLGYCALTTESLVALGERCPSLTTIGFVGCDGIDEAKLGSFAASCPQLTKIALARCPNLTPHAFALLVQHCSHLRAIDLWGTPGITDAIVEMIATHSQKLESIDLSHAHRITDEALESLARHCPALEELSIASCQWITPRGISAVVEGCPKLRLLRLAGNYPYGALDEIKKMCREKPSLRLIGN